MNGGVDIHAERSLFGELVCLLKGVSLTEAKIDRPRRERVVKPSCRHAGCTWRSDQRMIKFAGQLVGYTLGLIGRRSLSQTIIVASRLDADGVG